MIWNTSVELDDVRTLQLLIAIGKQASNVQVTLDERTFTYKVTFAPNVWQSIAQDLFRRHLNVHYQIMQ